jgi:hypothetical protein
MARTRRSVTYRDAEKYLKLIEQRFGKSAIEHWGVPRIVENWDGRGHFGICWEGFYEWSFYATTGSLKFDEADAEYGIRLPKVEIPASLSHIFSEPYDGCVLILYLET